MITLKSPSEIKKLQESADLVSEVHNRLYEIIEPGVTTIELDRTAEKIIKSYGARPAFKGYRGFPYSVCASLNEQVVHGFPSDRKLKEGDVLSLDIGVHYQGFIGDVARTYPVGQVSDEADKLIRRAYHALKKAGEAAQPGARIGDVSHAVEAIGRQYNYGVVRDFVGHAVGRDMHEDPQIPNYGKPGSGPRIKAGMVICVEPMFNTGTWEVQVLSDRWTVVTKDRSLSVHVEDMIAVLPDGPKVLSSAVGRIYPEGDDLKEEGAASLANRTAAI